MYSLLLAAIAFHGSIYNQTDFEMMKGIWLPCGSALALAALDCLSATGPRIEPGRARKGLTWFGASSGLDRYNVACPTMK